MDEQIKLCQHKLQTQFGNLTALTQLLDDELNSLVARRGENLKELAKNKINLLNAIQKIDKETSSFDTAIFEVESIKEAMQSIKTLLEQCQSKNEVNAKAAHQANLSVKELKSILIGAPTSITYGEDGSVVTGNSELVKNLKA